MLTYLRDTMTDKRISDIFFDLDHTLWDFEKNSMLTFQRIFAENQVSVELNSFLEYYVPLNLEYWKLYREERISKEDLRYERLKKSFDLLNYSVQDDLIHSLSEQYIAMLSTFNNLIPNTIEILEYLKPNYRLHIITNGFEEVQTKKLQASNIHHYFDKIINSEMAGVKKPNPRIFQLALDMASVNADNAVMIGDNIEADILGAQAVGLNALHYNAHNDPLHDHCEMIHDLVEIKSYL